MTKFSKIFSGTILFTAFFLFAVLAVSAYGQNKPALTVLKSNQYFNLKSLSTRDGQNLVQMVIYGPPEPPAGYELQRASLSLIQTEQLTGVTLLPDVPAFNWSFGCTATSAAMIAGYYDRTGWGNIYAGPTNNGVMPLDNSSWPDWVDSNGATRHQCPLSATHQGLDGRSIKGHVDDYWEYYNQPGPDPWVGNWTEHTHGECTGDYLNTNQWVNPTGGWNVDGSTVFYTYSSGAKLDCDTLDNYGPPYSQAGDVGFRRFFQSRGYPVTTCYSQRTDNIETGGFSFAEFKAEIDAGRPVMFHVTGHTMVGIGYDDSSNTIYFHDTWDYSVHSMTWGGSYSGMTQWGVTIVHVDPLIGDVNDSGNVSLADLIIALQVAAGFPTADVNPVADVNGDGDIGVAEALYIIVLLHNIQ